MVARRVLGFQGSAQPGSKMRPSAPKASAVRHRVPTFPGSWRPSSTRYLAPVSSSGRAKGGRAQRKRTFCGVSVGATALSRSAGTSTCRTPSGSSARGGHPACHKTTSSLAPHFRASTSIFGPSHTITPCCRRSLRSPVSLRRRVMRGLVLLVMVSISAHSPQPDNTTAYRRKPRRYAFFSCIPPKSGGDTYIKTDCRPSVKAPFSVFLALGPGNAESPAKSSLFIHIITVRRALSKGDLPGGLPGKEREHTCFQACSL